MNNEEKKIKSELKHFTNIVLNKLEDSRDANEAMSPAMQKLSQEIKDYNKAYKEFGYNGVNIDRATFTQKNEEFNEFINTSKLMEEKVKMFLEISTIDDQTKSYFMQDLNEELIMKKNFLNPNKIKIASLSVSTRLHNIVNAKSDMEIPQSQGNAIKELLESEQNAYKEKQQNKTKLKHN
jgi:hypothetical protein